MREPVAEPVNDVVAVERRGPHAVVWIDNPPVNAASHAVRAGLVDAVARIEASDAAGAVIACRGRTFVAGADVREFGRPPEDPWLPKVVEVLEACSKPLVAAIHGTALGGGFEVALGCHARVMDPKARVGLPEVTLGVIPGAGGTQRLPRLVGLAKAAVMVTGGKPIGAAEAERLGIATVAEGDLAEAALAVLEGMGGAVPEDARLSRRPAPEFDEAFEDAVRAAQARARGAVAPVRAVEALRAAAGPFADGMATERAIFTDLVASDQARALRHIFFAERAAAKPPVDAAPRAVATVGVIGAGTMGTGIALACLGGGLPVTLVETSDDALARGVARIEATLDGMVEKGRLGPEARDARRAALTGTTAMDDLAGADLVIEAAFEDMDVKREIFARLGGVAKPGAILATNTSYLDVDAIGAASGRAGDVLGLHFFSPAHIMKLLEIVRGGETAPDVLATGTALAKRLGKLPVVARNAFGFIGNRVLSDYRKQAEFLVEEGAAPADVDAAMRGYGMAMGPFEVSDLAGLDIARAVRRMRPPAPGARGAALADALCERGRLGRKTADTTGGGWYDYPKGKPVPSPEVAAMIDAARAEQGRTPRDVGAEEIVDRLTASMANAGAHVVGGGVARGPDDVDVVLVNGYGFPRWRGGPMFDAASKGWAATLASAEAACAAGGAGWEVAPWLRERAAEG